MALLKRVAGNLSKNDNTVIFATVAAFAMMVIGAVLMVADHESSRLGIEAMNLRTAIPYESFFVAAIFQVAQMVIVYVAGNNDLSVRVTRIMTIAYIFCLVADLATDTYHKAVGLPFIMWVIAFGYSLGVFTIGSEIMFVVGGSIFLEIAPEGILKAGQFLGKMWDLFASGLSYIFGEPKDDSSDRRDR